MQGSSARTVLHQLSPEHLVSNLLEVIPCVLFSFRLIEERTAAIPYASNKLADIVGLEPQNLEQDAAPFLNRIHPDDIDSFFASAEESRNTMEPWHIEFRMIHPANREIWLEWRATPDEQGGEMSWQGIMLDITERRRMYEELRRSEQAFRDLAESSPDFITHYDLKHRIRYINRKLLRELELTSVDEVFGRTPDEVWPDGRFTKITETLKKVIATGDVASIELHVPRSDGSVDYHQLLAALKYDAEGQIIGTMLYGRNITAIREKEHRLQYIVDNLPGVIGTFRLFPDGHGTIPFISPNIEEICGLTPEQAQSNTAALLDCVHPEDLARIKAAVADSATTLEPIHLEYRISVADKPECHLAMHAKPEQQPDGTVLWTSVMLDITRRKETEREMTRLQHAIDVSADGIFIIDDTMRFVDVNTSACHQLGYSRDELLGKTPLDINPDTTPEQLAQMAGAGGHGQSITIETRHRTKDGDIFPVEIATTPFVERDEKYAIAVVRDISERKQAEREMMRLQDAINVSSDSIFIMGDGARFVDVNDTACRSLGYSRDELLGKTPQDIDPSLTQEQLEHLIKISHEGISATLETLHRTADGRVFPVEIASSPFVEEGKRYTITTARDITERKQGEARLRMAASVFETAAEGIIITDPQGRVLDVNPAFTDITGYELEEIAGKSPGVVLASGQHDQQFYQAMWLQLETEGRWYGEITNRRKDGEIYIEQLNVVAVYDAEENLTHYIGIFNDISLLKSHERHLRHIAYHDTLTSLPNRPLLTKYLSQTISKEVSEKQMLAIFYIDLDGFKPINDHYGHETGDHVLVAVAHRLTSSLRPGDTLARIGGDEFVVVLTGISGNEECKEAANRLLDTVAQPVIIDNHSMNLTASIGVFLHPGHLQYDADTLLRFADQAMNHAKSAGRNQFVFYETSSKNDINKDQTIYDLRQALAEDQISVHYQPIFDLNTGKIVKAEALVRWHHPVLGMVPPSEFIPVAENMGLIHEIGDLVFRHAARLAYLVNKRHTTQSGDPVRISINRSARQFCHRNGVEAWKNYLEEQKIPGELLSVEITESLLLDDWPDVIQQLNQLRDMGMDVLLDDFGTGYSALPYLKKYNIDYLKIDRSFVGKVVDDPDNQAIINSTITMANQLGIRTIGEGVETEAQADLLKAFGCDLVQGFLYAKPMPESEFLHFMTAHSEITP